MRVKRKVGQKSKILFDQTDIDIIKVLHKEQPIAVLELAKKLGNMKHANLKKHLDMLESNSMTLIKRENVPKSRKILVSLNEEIYTKERIGMLLKMFS